MSPTIHQYAPCRWCGDSAVMLVKGRFIVHGSDHASVCRSSATVPWRMGTPDVDTVHRHLQTNYTVNATFALFQVREGTAFPAIVSAEFATDGTVVWGYSVPGVGLPGGRFTPRDDFAAWRPIDIDTHEARPWIDP